MKDEHPTLFGNGIDESIDEINCQIPNRKNDSLTAESDLIDSLLNEITFIEYFHRSILFLDCSLSVNSHFSNQFHRKLIILILMEGEIRLIKRLIYDNSSPRPPEDLSIESFSPFLSVRDSDYFMEKIDIFLDSDNSTPPGVESDYDSEGDILFLEELINDDLVPLSKYNHFTFDVEPDTAVRN
ncbi:hypothetical protein Tco_0904018 [Tanacetum coccineum]